MRCVVRSLCLATLSIALVVSETAAQVSFDKSKWPVYYGDAASGGYLEVVVSEKAFDPEDPLTPYGKLLANVSPEDHTESIAAPEILLRYLERVMDGDYDRAADLYGPHAKRRDAIAGAERLSERLTGLTEVRFLSEFFFRRSKSLMVQLGFDKRPPEVLTFGFEVTASGFLLSDDWGFETDALRGLFDYLAMQAGEGWTTNYRSRPFRQSMVIEDGIFGIVLNFDGRLYADSGDWISPGRAAVALSPNSYVENVIAASATLGDADFIDMWCKTAQDDLIRTLAVNPKAYAALKKSTSSAGNIKHVMTVNIERDYVHYFMESQSPGALRAIFVRNENDGYCLTRGPHDRKVENFLRSDLVKGAILRRWGAQS